VRGDEGLGRDGLLVAIPAAAAAPLARYGGDEFLFVLFGLAPVHPCEDLQAAHDRADKELYRKRVQRRGARGGP
jgi:hypothetical protein